MAYVMKRQMTVKLPEPLVAFIGDKAAEAHISRTEVLINAISCLRERDTEALMAEGSRERAELNCRLADENLRAASDTWPEW